MYYINIFFIFSFLGFLFENLLTLLINSNFNSGILYGPWTFIYGIAIFCLMFVNKTLHKKNWRIWIEVIVFFFISALLMTFLEYSGGMLIEKLFHRVYWDYTNMKFNFGNYICLEASIFWGLFATLVNYLLVPSLEKFAKKIPKLITVVLMILFVVDIVMTVLN